MSEIELSDIDGIGPARAETMTDELGIETVDDLADTAPETLASEISTVNDEKAVLMVEQAIGATEVNVDETEVSEESNDGEEIVEDATGESSEDDGPAVFPITLTIPAHTFPFALRAMSNHYAVVLGRNAVDELDTVARLMEPFTDAYNADELTPGDDVSVSMDVTMTDLNTLDSAFSEEVRRARSQAGTNEVSGDIQIVLDQIGDLRQKHWGN